MAWFISYRHSLRLDEAGVKFVTDHTEVAAEKQRLELLGYVVTDVARNPYARTHPSTTPPVQNP